MANIERWMMKLIYDKKKKTFNMGYNERGVDKVDALDTVSWTIPALNAGKIGRIGSGSFLFNDFCRK
jgi:hypothetical protein